jgi:ADP-ribose pyrophosphatase YjhB (NUDIX family)
MIMKQENQLELIKRIKALADTGLVYAQNGYDKERYEELRIISLQLLGEVVNKPLSVLNDFILPDKDYPTPKVDIRGVILNEAKDILLVKEMDGKWSLPGGWGDIGFSPSEVICKEIKEETGLSTSVLRLMAVYDKKCHPYPPQPFYVYKLVFLCEIESGEIETGFDIADIRFYSIYNLPEISEDRILKSQIEELHQKVLKDDTCVYFD